MKRKLTIIIILFTSLSSITFAKEVDPKNLPIDSVTGCPLMIYYDEHGFLHLKLYPYNDRLLKCIKEDSLGNCIETNYPDILEYCPNVGRTPDYVITYEDVMRILDLEWELNFGKYEEMIKK